MIKTNNPNVEIIVDAGKPHAIGEVTTSHFQFTDTERLGLVYEGLGEGPPDKFSDLAGKKYLADNGGRSPFRPRSAVIAIQS